MMKKVYASVMIAVLNTFSHALWAQSFSFKDDGPVLWHHLVKGDGYSDTIRIFWAINGLDGVKIVGDGLYLLHFALIQFYEGYTVEKIDLNTGEALWTHTVLGVDKMNREYPSIPYITGDSSFNVLVFRQKDTANTNVLWQEAVFGLRSYDLLTGEVIDSSFADRKDSTVATLRPIGGSFIKKVSLLYPDTNHLDTFYYLDRIFLSSTILNNIYKLDKRGRVVDSLFSHTTLRHNVDNYSYRLLENGSIVFLYHSPAIFFGEKDDLTLEVVKLRGLKFDTTYLDLSSTLSGFDRSILTYADTTKFIIKAKKETRDIIELKLLCYDYHARLLGSAEIMVDKREFPEFEVSNPLLLEDGKMLYAMTWQKDSVSSIITLVKSDSSGNREVIGILEPVAENSVIKTDYLIDIDDNRLLVGISDRKTLSNTRWKYLMNWVMLSKEELLKSIGTKMPKDPIDVTIYPNPVREKIRIINGKLNVRAYQLYNSDGQIVKSGIISTDGIDVHNLPAGLYILRLRMRNRSEVCYKVLKM